MRNKNVFSLGALVALFVLVAGVSLALDRQAAAQQTPPVEPPAARTPEQKSQPQTPAGDESRAGQDEAGEQPQPRRGAEEPARSGDQDTEAPERFIPSQRTSADNNATFPVDI